MNAEDVSIKSLTQLNQSNMITRAEVLIGLTLYYEQGDLSFIDTVNNISYGYKRDLKTNLTKQKNDKQNKR